MSSKPHPAIKEISPQQWSELTVKLTAYTLGFFRRHYGSIDVIGRGENLSVDSDVILPGGFSAADISQEIVLKVLEGARNWNPDLDGDLLDYMVRQVRSLASHCIRSWSGKHEIGVEDGDESTAEELVDLLAVDAAKDEREDLLSVEDRMMDKEAEAKKSELINEVLSVAGTDPELEEIVLAFIDNPDPRRRFIAERLGKTPEEITNAVKRLRTKVLKAKKQQSKLLGEEDE